MPHRDVLPERAALRIARDGAGGVPGIGDEVGQQQAKLGPALCLGVDERLVDLRSQGGEEIVVAMHALLAPTPCWLLLVSPYDVVGEPRQPNLPGTVDEYLN
jgi:4-alpha-glucanotransferase